MAKGGAFDDMIQVVLYVCFAIYLCLGLALLIMGIIYMGDQGAVGITGGGLCAIGGFMLILGGLGLYSNYEQIWVLLAVVELISIALFLILTAIIVIAMIFAMGYTDPVGDLIDESWSDIANNEALSYNTDPKSVCFRYVPECETYSDSYEQISNGATNGCHREVPGELSAESRAQFFADVFMSEHVYTGKGGSNYKDRNERAMCFFPEKLADGYCAFYKPCKPCAAGTTTCACVRYTDSDFAVVKTTKNCGPKAPQATTQPYCHVKGTPASDEADCTEIPHWVGCASTNLVTECLECNHKCKDYITREARAGTEAVAFFVLATVCFCVIAVIWNNFLTRGGNDEFDGIFSILGYVINGAVLLVGLTMVVLCIIRLVQSDGYTGLLLGIMFLGIFLLGAGGMAVGGLYGSNPLLINIASALLALFGYIMLILGIGLAVCTGFVMDEAQTQYDQNYHKIREAVEKFDATFCQLTNADCERLTVFGHTNVPVMYDGVNPSGSDTHDPTLQWDHQYLAMQAEQTWIKKTYAHLQSCASHKVCVACAGLISGKNVEKLTSSSRGDPTGRAATSNKAPLSYTGGGTVFTRGSSSRDGVNSKATKRKRGAVASAATKDSYVDWKADGGAFHDGVDILQIIKTIRQYEGKVDRALQSGFCAVNPNAETFWTNSGGSVATGFGYLTGCDGTTAEVDYGCKESEASNVDCKPNKLEGEKCEMGWVFKDAFKGTAPVASHYHYQAGDHADKTAQISGNTGFTKAYWDTMTDAEKEAFSSGRTRTSQLNDADSIKRDAFDRSYNFGNAPAKTADSKQDSSPAGFSAKQYVDSVGIQRTEDNTNAYWPARAVAGDLTSGVERGVFGVDTRNKAAGAAFTTRIAVCPTGCKKTYKSFESVNPVNNFPTCYKAGDSGNQDKWDGTGSATEGEGSQDNHATDNRCKAANGCVLVKRLREGTANVRTAATLPDGKKVGDTKLMNEFRATTGGGNCDPAASGNPCTRDNNNFQVGGVFAGSDNDDKITASEASLETDPATTAGTFNGFNGIDGPERKAEMVEYMINVTYAWRNRSSFSSNFEGSEVAQMTGKCEAALNEWSSTTECGDFKGKVPKNQFSMYRDLEGCAKCSAVNFATATNGEEKVACIKAMYAKARPAMCDSKASKDACRTSFSLASTVTYARIGGTDDPNADLAGANGNCRPSSCSSDCTAHASDVCTSGDADYADCVSAKSAAANIKAKCALFTAFRMKMPQTFCQFTDDACKAKLKQKTKDDLKWVGIFGGIFCAIFLVILYFGYRGVIVYMTDDDDDDDDDE